MFKIFIDDERMPPDDGSYWYIVRNFNQFKHVITTERFPNFISFDHDLGENEPTGYDIAHYIVELDLDHNIIPGNFKWYTHSQNPIGKANIDNLLTKYLDFKKKSSPTI